eukprot:765655-Hanusia_phi.AAC.4
MLAGLEEAADGSKKKKAKETVQGDGWGELEAKNKNPDSFNVFDSSASRAMHQIKRHQSVASQLANWQEELKKRESGTRTGDSLSFSSPDDF